MPSVRPYLAGRPVTARDEGDGWAYLLRCAEDTAVLLRRERDEERARAERYLQLVQTEVQRHVALQKAVRNVHELLTGYSQDRAQGSRDFGRGYALAVRDVTAVLDQLLKENP